MTKAAIYKGNKTFAIVQVKHRAIQPDEVRIRVNYCGICGTDRHIYHGTMDKRINPPQIIGHEMSGLVSEVGDAVRDIEIGNPVVVRPLDNSGEEASDKGYSHICKKLKFIGIDSEGAMQESWIVPAFSVHKLPPHTDMKIASLVEPLAVACHDVKMAKVQKDETVVVIGGGPIGLLIALVAMQKGARIILLEVNAQRLAKAEELGCIPLNPLQSDVSKEVNLLTAGYGADTVFEVSGTPEGVQMMTELAGIRGRIVMVAIHTLPRETSLFQFFWKELTMIGARVYEKDDYEQAISYIHRESLPLEELISGVYPLGKIQEAFENLDRNEENVKIILDCQNVD